MPNNTTPKPSPSAAYTSGTPYDTQKTVKVRGIVYTVLGVASLAVAGVSSFFPISIFGMFLAIGPLYYGITNKRTGLKVLGIIGMVANGLLLITAYVFIAQHPEILK